MRCQKHECEMEWLPAMVGFADGFWSCERCVEEEEAGFESEEDEDYDPMGDYYPCACTQCNCMVEVEDGGVCADCQEERHQG